MQLLLLNVSNITDSFMHWDVKNMFVLSINQILTDRANEFTVPLMKRKRAFYLWKENDRSNDP